MLHVSKVKDGVGVSKRDTLHITPCADGGTSDAHTNTTSRL